MDNSNISGAFTAVYDLSFKKIANDWLIFKKSNIKLSSYVKYQNMLNQYLIPYFSEKNIKDIKRNDVIFFVDMLLNEGGVKKRGLSQSTVNCVLSVIKGIYLYAEQCELSSSVPNLCNLTTKKEQKKLRVLSKNEQLKLSRHLSESNSLKSMGILLCLYTGIRIGEICALKWGDISFDESFLTINKTMQRIQNIGGNVKTRVVTEKPKSHCSERLVPIPANMLKIITKLRCPANTYFLSGTEKYIEPRTLQNHFKAVIKECGIENANFHSLRHTFATRCVELGFDVKSLSEILGHSSVNITMNRYVHPSMELKQQNMNKLSSMLDCCI